MLKNTILSIIFICMSTSFLISQNIDGESLVCLYECETYTIKNTSSGLFVWNVEGGKLDVNTGTSVRICWKEEGEQSIKVLDLSPNAPSPILTFNVKVDELSYPEVFFPNVPSCAVLDSFTDPGQGEFPPLECYTACEKSTGIYTAIGKEGSTFEWFFEGATNSSATGQSIEINWGDAGYGYIVLTEGSEAGCDNGAEYCVQILERPTATITDETNIASPCIGQSIYLTADSPDAVEFSWEINGAIVSAEKVLEYEIPSNDVMNISLITTSECMCQDTTNYVITPQPEPGPQISCVGTTCLGSEETYYAEDICGTYNWSVSSEGTITDGGGTNDNYVTINWNNGPLGEISLSATNCQNTICNSITTVKIPIIEPSIDIDGPTVTCKKGVTVFTAPKFAGTSYSWSLNGNGTIIDGQNTNQISIQWESTAWSDNETTITLSYENCLLECSGSAQKVVTLKPEFIISSWDPNACYGEEITVEGFSEYSSVKGDWQVIDKLGTVIATASDESFIRFNAPNQPGLLEVTLTNTSGTYCNETSSGSVKVISPPDIPTTFDGPLVICLNELYTYEGAIDLQNDIQLIWVFNDGINTTMIEGNKVNYTWSSNGPYSIELVSKNITTNCSSEALTVEVKETSTTSIIGQNEVCIDELRSFSLSGVESENVEWTITPITAGNFKIGEGIETEIIFYEPGTHQLTANYCGTSLSINVDVYEKPTFTHDAPIGICENEKATLTIITDVNNAIEVADESFNIIGTTSSLEIGPGIYTIKTTSPVGCEEIEVVIIDKYDLPDIRISSPDQKGFCNFPFDVKIYANDAIDGYTYKWYKDDVEIANTSDTIIANEYATFHLEATNINGCVNKSNSIRVYKECKFPDEYSDGRCEGLAPCPSMDSINFVSASLGFCNTYSFTNTSTANVDPSTLRYDFDNEQSGINNIVFQPNAEHTFSHAGYYTVMLLGEVPSLANPSNLCDDYETQLIEVPVAANFESQEACSNVEYEFLDKSTFVADNTITNYEWNFGDPSSGADNTSSDRNPKHLFSTSGTFLVTLTITSGSGCRAKIIKEVRILQAPVFDLNLPFEQCISEAIKFEALDTGNLIKYLWEFDDPTGGNSNNVESATSLHLFQTPGTYSVSLTCYNNLGCESTVVKTFEVGTNNLTGDITLDKTLPICEGDSITLTAPNGGVGYIWSNGEVEQSIKVVDPEKYSVTVINATACDYVPEDVTITVKPRPNIRIYGITYEENAFDGTIVYEKLEFCEGEYANIRTQSLVNATYLWSSGGTTWFNSNIDTRTLAPGEHEFTVDVTTSNGCTYTSDPFTVKINPLPQSFTISSNVPVMCEGEVFNLNIDSPDSEYTYYWSTGQVGTSISAQLPGNYSVTAVNKFGCTRQSNRLTIHEKPNMTFFQTGCFETCFPDEICFPQSGSISLLSWIKDGQIISGANSDVLTVTEAGEYQVMVESLAGCTETSEILTLEAMPSDQSVSGIVYVDENGNGTFDTSEELLENINIQLMTGTTVLATSTTNTLGEYLIDPVTSTNTYLLLDTIGTGLQLTSLELQYDLTFDLCVEDKIQNFPVTKNCAPIVERLDLIVCQGETVTFNSVVYNAGDTDNVLVTAPNGCDTTFNISVLEAQVPLLNSTTGPSCKNLNNGTLDIQTAETGMTYSIDGINFTDNINYTDLAAGNYTLEVMNENNCIFAFPFLVQEINDPIVSINTNNTCPQSNNGEIEVSSSEVDLSYSIDGINFTNSNTFENLSPSNYNLVIMNSNGCTYDYNVNISEIQEPLVNFNTTATCANNNNGSLEITFSDPGTTFSMDGNNFGTTLIYDNLSTGNQTLYVSSSEQCIFEYSVNIPESTPPVYSALSTNTCIGEDNGSIEIQSTTTGISYSMDGINFTSQNIFDNLAAGNQTIYIQDDLGCIYQESLQVENNQAPDLTLNTTLSCNDDGAIEIFSNDGNTYSYSLTNTGFSNSSQFTNLAAGEYSVFILGNNNCVSEQVFTIEESIEPLLQFDIVPTCVSSSNGSISAVSNNTLVQYSIDGSTFSNNSLFENIGEGDYTITVMDEFGCIFDNQVTVNAIENLEVSFTDPTIDCTISSVSLQPEIQSGSNLSYEWSNGSVANGLTATQSGLYSVEVSNGCETETYEWNLEFDNIKTESVFVPNVFSPNDDGDNDAFQAFKTIDLDVVEFDLAIFDKWGNKVFENKSIDQVWDGRYNSKKVQTGVYVWRYKMTANYCDEEITLNNMGSVTLLR